MNKLTKHLVDGILKEEEGVTALFGGSFKPPTKGHLEVVTKAIKEYPEINQVIIYVGSGVRNNISQEEAVKVWEMYQKLIPVPSQIIATSSPFKAYKQYLTDHPEDTTYVLIGGRLGNEEDDKDIAERSKYIGRYNGIPKVISTPDAGISGTAARAAAKISKEKFLNFIPDELDDNEKDLIYAFIQSVVNELEDREIGFWAKHADLFNALKKGDQSYKELAQSLNGRRKEALDYFYSTYFQHGKSLTENASYSKDIDIKGKIDQLTQHMIDKGYNIEPLPALEFVDGDSENARDFFGKTAYYEPNTQTIVLYTEGRHPKDIVRSYAHEMIHHIQNLEGRLGNITTTNTQEDDYLNDIEAEANLKGTMTFRNWTDSLNEGKKGVDNSMVAVLSKNGHQISLYDFDNKEPLGLINTYGNEVTGIVAKKGYGPLMYELGMANVYPNGLQSDRNGNTEPAAEEVLNKFIEGASPNIKTVKLTPKDKEYRTEYPNGNEIWDVDGFYNYKFYNADASTLKQLLQKGNELSPNEQSDIISSTKEMYDSMVNEGADSLNEVGDASQKPYKWTRSVFKDDDIIEGVDYRFTTDLDTNYVAFFQMVGDGEFEFGFNIPGGNQAQVSNKGELFKVMATMVAIMEDFMNLLGNEWVKIVFSGSKDPSRFEDNRRDKLYMAYIKKNLPSSVEVGPDEDDPDMTALTNTLAEGFDKKLGKDPFGLEQFARELVMEGAYDALTTKLTKATINKWVEDSKKKPMPKKSFVDIDVDEVDGKGREIEFNYVGLVEFDKKVDGYEVDGTSNSGEDEGKMPFVATLFKINPKVLPQAWSKISADVSDVIRHEIEHLTQAGDNVRGQQYDEKGNLVDKGKYMEDDIILRDLINKAKVLPQSDYYKLEKEVDAMLQGLYLKAKKTKKPFKDVIKNYLSIAPGIETKEDREIILNLWRSRRGALSLPVFENKEGVMDYKIFLDMDGVLVNFDEQFKELTGEYPKDYEKTHTPDEFWGEIDGAGVGFWRGMKWMPGGEALYNRAAQFDHVLLSSPSRSETSKIGKRLWRRDKTPNTKLILARSYNKKKYAAANHILIDDREDNIQQWRDAGGIGILYKSAEQVNKELDKLGL